jgi:hypothetical protein
VGCPARADRTLWLVIGFATGLLALALSLPALGQLFQFAPLSAPALMAALALGLIGVLGLEVLKFSRRWIRRSRTGSASW